MELLPFMPKHRTHMADANKFKTSHICVMTSERREFGQIAEFEYRTHKSPEEKRTH